MPIVDTQTIMVNKYRKVTGRRWRTHSNFTETPDNIRDAIEHAMRTRDTTHYGCNVYILIDGYREKIFQAKWGSDNIPFNRFDGSLGVYWGKRLGYIK